MDTSGATVVRFRTALAGFHKGDVTNYISQSARANRDTVSDLKQQIQALQEENAQLRSTAADSDYIAELEEKASALADLQQENVLLKNRVRQLEFKLEEAESAIQEAPQEEPAAQESHDEDIKAMELAAYRRAEEMERRVSQRARMLATQLDGIAQQSSQKLDAAVDSAKNVLASIASQLQILHNTSEDLNFAMADSLEQMKMVSSLLSDADETTGE